MPENAFSNYFPPSRSSSHIWGCAHTPRPPTGARLVCSPRDFLPVNDGPILKAAAACPTAPSGAENQNNFIVIISLLLSPSLSLVEEGVERMKTQKMCVSRLAGCSGPSPSVLLLDIFSFLLLWRLWWILGFYALTRITVTSNLCSSRLLIVPEIMFQLTRSGFLKQELWSHMEQPELLLFFCHHNTDSRWRPEGNDVDICVGFIT